jgi:hypothetical protein
MHHSHLHAECSNSVTLLGGIAQKLGSLFESLQDAVWRLRNIASHQIVETLRPPGQRLCREGLEPALHNLARELQPCLGRPWHQRRDVEAGKRHGRCGGLETQEQLKERLACYIAAFRLDGQAGNGNTSCIEGTAELRKIADLVRHQQTDITGR